MRWLANIYDPKQPNAKIYIQTDLHQTQADAWALQERWLADKVIGEPQATDTCSVAELQARHMIGVYQEATR